MAKILLLDLETTGLDPYTARPWGYCFSLVDTDDWAILHQKEGFMWDDSYPPIPPIIEQITHSFTSDVKAAANPTSQVLDALVKSASAFEFLVAHNGRAYDKIVLEAELARHGLKLPSIPWIDTRNDLPFPERMRCRILSHLAFEHKIPVDIDKLHGAKADVDLMYQIFTRYNFNDIVKLATEKTFTLWARVTFDEKEHAKRAGFKWDSASKRWLKEVRDSQLETIRQALSPCQFEIIKE